jgi:hypothetical protein
MSILNTENQVVIDYESVSSDEEDFDVQYDYRQNPSELNKHTVNSTVLRSAIPARLKTQSDEFLIAKSNSTSTLFVSSTIDSPNVNNIVYCLGKALFFHIKESQSKPPPSSIINRVFSEEVSPLSASVDCVNAPDLNTINEFIGLIFQGEQLSAECAVMSLAYIDRLISLTENFYLHACNWRRIVLGAIVLASKVFEEQAVWNVDFLSVFPDLSISDLNTLERQFINAIQFMVTLKSSVYTKYYFELRSLSDEESTYEELTEEKLEELESRSRGYEVKAKTDLAHLKRKTRSLGGPNIKQGKAKANIHNT